MKKNEHNLWEITGLAFTSRTYWSQVAAYMQNPQPKPLTKEEKEEKSVSDNVFRACLLYTSDAADDTR